MIGIPLIVADGIFRYIGSCFMFMLAVGILRKGYGLNIAIEVRNNSRLSVEDGSLTPPEVSNNSRPSAENISLTPPEVLNTEVRNNSSPSVEDSSPTPTPPLPDEDAPPSYNDCLVLPPPYAEAVDLLSCGNVQGGQC
eukprot:GHVS01015382.1.p1 GENE.GHVS01015382.1~~GHVS01015382.1.p1  ORF type:complete len:138 (-),score=23.27 GHVS01015382.1:571-984(-)